MKQSSRKQSRRWGAVAPLVALIIIPVFIAMLAFSVDMGNICFTQSQLQRAADAGALAGAAELLKHNKGSDAASFAVAEAQRVVKQMSAGNVSTLYVASADVQVGYTDQAAGTFTVYAANSTLFPNTVKVTVRRQGVASTDSNGNVTNNGAQPTYFAGFFGQNSWNLESSATANTIIASSFNSTAGPGLLLPFAVNQSDWNGLMAQWQGGTGTDNYSVGTTLNPPQGGSAFGAYTVTSGTGDGIPEMTIYGNQGTNAPGNFGLIRLNPNDPPNTPNIENWVSNGPSATDLASLTFPSASTSLGVWWDGTPGFKNAINSSVQGIVGEARLVPIYDNITGSGANAEYNIIGFGAVTVLNWTGNGAKNTQMTIQPTTAIDPSLAGTSYGNGLPPTSPNPQTGIVPVYAPPKLTQ